MASGRAAGRPGGRPAGRQRAGRRPPPAISCSVGWLPWYSYCWRRQIRVLLGAHESKSIRFLKKSPTPRAATSRGAAAGGLGRVGAGWGAGRLRRGAACARGGRGNGQGWGGGVGRCAGQWVTSGMCQGWSRRATCCDCEQAQAKHGRCSCCERRARACVFANAPAGRWHLGIHPTGPCGPWMPAACWNRRCILLFMPTSWPGGAGRGGCARLARRAAEPHSQRAGRGRFARRGAASQVIGDEGCAAAGPAMARCPPNRAGRMSRLLRARRPHRQLWARGLRARGC
jgi:hypothetical protein